MISSESVKTEVLNILKSFDIFCRDNDIKYCLGYGTLLGAIRHKGFIPWDDDIDVILKTEEYDKLKALGEKDPYIDEQKRYRMLIPGDQNYCYSFIKIEDTNYKLREKNVSDDYAIGLFIDVFRMDNWPETGIKETIQLKKARLLLKMNEICIRGNLEEEKYKTLDKLLKPVDLVYKLFGLRTEKFCRILENQGRHNKKSVFIGNIMSGSGRKSERLEASILDNYIDVQFEDGVFPAPERYDDYLRTIYGDYMVLPKEEDQVGHEYDIVETGRKGRSGE